MDTVELKDEHQVVKHPKSVTMLIFLRKHEP
jgi:hypothetical protein